MPNPPPKLTAEEDEVVIELMPSSLAGLRRRDARVRRKAFEKAAEAVQQLWFECQVEKKRFYVEGKYELGAIADHHCEAFKAAGDRVLALVKEKADG